MDLRAEGFLRLSLEGAAEIRNALRAEVLVSSMDAAENCRLGATSR
jgi:hypothetical protein